MARFCFSRLYLGIENVCLSCVATDGKDGHGLKLEKVGPTFSIFNATTWEISAIWLAESSNIFQLNLKYLATCENYKPFVGSSINK